MKSLIVLFLITLLSGTFSVSAQVSDLDSQSIREKELQTELDRINREKQVVEGQLNVTKKESASIGRDINVLTGEIRKTELTIEEKSLAIQRLGGDIEKKEETITGLKSRVERNQASIARLLTKTQQAGDYSLVEIILANENLSEFFVDTDSYQAINASLGNLSNDLRDLQGQIGGEKVELQQKQVAEIDTKAEVIAEKRTVERKKQEKDTLLSVKKQEEKTYEELIRDKERQAQEIRSALFSLRDTEGISFGDAVDYAKEAGARTGVRPAFILAILKQETNIGQNVGTCNRPGDPDLKKWFNIMPGPTDGSWRDDQTAYQKIVTRLGRPIEGTPLSCPMNASTWGGAMGPSQFIPATWLQYEPRIEEVLGVAVADPWNPYHAFTATALYVKDLGAGAGGFTAERTAALKYYAGSNWSKPQNQFYGDSVMGHAVTLQESLDFLAELDAR